MRIGPSLSPAPSMTPAPTSRRCRCATSLGRYPLIGSCSSRDSGGHGQPCRSIVLSRQKPCAVRPLPDSRAVMVGARPVCLLAVSGHRPGMAPVDGELGQHREPAQRDEVGNRRVRQRGWRPVRRGRSQTGNRRRIRVDRRPLRHPRDAGAGDAVAQWRIRAYLRVVVIANPMRTAYRLQFSVGTLAEKRFVGTAAGTGQHQPTQE